MSVSGAEVVGGGIKNGWDGYEGGERENWLT